MANHLEPNEAISYRGLLMFVQYWDNVVSTNNWSSAGSYEEILYFCFVIPSNSTD